ncbi:MAG: hypothetical protein SWH78_06410 [Thermodesulfobacteriota bacterium]|nr:hypothetical protein [Thermodesulfobacteriota bacterium]
MQGAGEIRNWLHHNLNSLHVYCRLSRIMPGGMAREIVLIWENTAIYSFMYARN